MAAHVRFDVICGSSTDHDCTIHHCNMSAVPSPGEVINVKGNPYVVVERGWAAADADHGDGYSYLRISNLYVHTEAVLDDRRYKVKRIKDNH